MKPYTHRALTSLLVAAVLSTATPHPGAAEVLPADLTHAREVAADKLATADATLPLGRYPVYTESGVWQTVSAGSWTSGFLPGSLW